MRALIAVMSCHSRSKFRELIRSTWAKLVPQGTDMKFFLGRGETKAEEDEVVLDCEDGYYDIPDKVRSIVRWALKHGYDYMLKCDDDVVLIPEKLMASDFCNYEFVGGRDPRVVPGEINTPWGFCYWLSQTTMKLVENAPLPGEIGSTHSYKHNNDEAWISTILYIQKIFLHTDERYYLHRGSPPYLAPEPKSGRRTLRANRLKQSYVEQPYPVGTFAFCIHLEWYGWHETPEEELHAEFRKVFIRETN
jgi:Galactosyltransferase